MPLALAASIRVAVYLEDLGHRHSAPTVKQHLAAIRCIPGSAGMVRARQAKGAGRGSPETQKFLHSRLHHGLRSDDPRLHSVTPKDDRLFTLLMQCAPIRWRASPAVGQIGQDVPGNERTNENRLHVAPLASTRGRWFKQNSCQARLRPGSSQSSSITSALPEGGPLAPIGTFVMPRSRMNASISARSE
jgi:hypothetical protein